MAHETALYLKFPDYRIFLSISVQPKCESGYKLIGKQCYKYLNTEKKSWFDAKTYCKNDQNGKLAEPPTLQVMNQLITYIRKFYRPRCNGSFNVFPAIREGLRTPGTVHFWPIPEVHPMKNINSLLASKCRFELLTRERAQRTRVLIDS